MRPLPTVTAGVSRANGRSRGPGLGPAQVPRAAMYHPSAMRWHYPYTARRYALPMLAALAAWFAATMTLSATGVLSKPRYAIPWHAAGFVLISAMTLHVAWRIWRFDKKVRDSGNRVCLYCAYDLRGLDAGEPCPECGNTPRGEPDERGS